MSQKETPEHPARAVEILGGVQYLFTRGSCRSPKIDEECDRASTSYPIVAHAS